MASSGTFSDRSPPPFDKHKDDYSKWKKKLSLWQAITDIEKNKQGGLITLRLDDETQELVLESIDTAELTGEEGAKKVTDYLDKLFQKDKLKTEFEMYEEFEQYKRPYDLKMSEYINEFERRWKKTNSKGTQLSQNVLAYRLLKSANLTEENERLLKATVKEMTYDGVKDQLKKIFAGRVAEEISVNVKTEIEDTFLVHKTEDTPYYKLYGYEKSNRNLKRNPLGEDGRVIHCSVCNSIYHLGRNCPDKEMNENLDGTGENYGAVALHINASCEKSKVCNLVKESFGSAVLDSGANKTVCGRLWFQDYLHLLTPDEKRKIKSFDSCNEFSFGDGKTFKSLRLVEIPAVIGKVNVNIMTDVVDANIPLLLSLEAMKRGKVECLNLMDETVTILGQKVKVKIAKSGHFLLPLSKSSCIVENRNKFNSLIRKKKEMLTTEKRGLKDNRKVTRKTVNDASMLTYQNDPAVFNKNRKTTEKDCKVYIIGLGKVEKYKLENLFNYYGAVKKVWIDYDKTGFTYVLFYKSKDAKDAVTELDGRNIYGYKCSFSLTHPQMSPNKSVNESYELQRSYSGDHVKGRSYLCKKGSFQEWCKMRKEMYKKSS